VFVNLIAAIPMSSDYDSDESTGSAAFQPSAIIPASPVSNDPTFELSRNGTRFLIVDHTANQRHGSKASGIWLHGGERRRCENGSMDRYWRCGHCTIQKTLKVPETGTVKAEEIDSEVDSNRCGHGGPEIAYFTI
jgi:hypothetical protein